MIAPEAKAPTRNLAEGFVRHALYPVLAAATVVYLYVDVNAAEGAATNLGRWYGAYLIALVVTMLVVEHLAPLRAEWRMTSRLFLRRDLPYLVIGGATLTVINAAGVHVATHFQLARGGAAASLPITLGAVLAILLTDFAWYWVHRVSHEAKGRAGRFMWRVHVAHHLPAQVYVLMHVVGHPLNAIIVRALLTVPLYALGFPPESVFIAGVVTGFQGLVSHFNVDSRVGWLNYLLIGTELHRHHHSADVNEAKNYGAVVSLWDQLFGTFHYQPGRAPKRLGVDDATLYPADVQIGKVMALPFR